MQAQDIFTELMQEFLAAGIPLKVKQINPVLQYNRAVTKLGQCRKEGDTYTIFLSVHAMKDEEQIRHTLAHELVHTLPGCMNHGKTFHRYGRMVEERLGITVESKADQEEAQASGIKEAYQARARYMIKCSKCGTSIYRQRASELIKHPSRYRCSRCGGTFEVYVRQ